MVLVRRDQVLAELSGGGARRIALAPGEYAVRLDEDDFFREVGRNDLAESYRKRRATRVGLFGAGLAVAIGGTVAAIASVSSSDDCNVPPGDPSFADACVHAPGKAIDRAILLGGIGAVVGGGLMLGAARVDPHPVKVDEIRRLADEYNVALRRRLGSPEKPKPTRDERLLTFYVAPGAGPTVRGLTLGVAF